MAGHDRSLTLACTARIHFAGLRQPSSTKKRGIFAQSKLLLGHTKIESTVRYLGIEMDDALAVAEQIDV
jgi:hypothetical protein